MFQETNWLVFVCVVVPVGNSILRFIISSILFECRWNWNSDRNRKYTSFAPINNRNHIFFILIFSQNLTSFYFRSFVDTESTGRLFEMRHEYSMFSQMYLHCMRFLVCNRDFENLCSMLWLIAIPLSIMYIYSNMAFRRLVLLATGYGRNGKLVHARNFY